MDNYLEVSIDDVYSISLNTRDLKTVSLRYYHSSNLEQSNLLVFPNVDYAYDLDKEEFYKLNDNSKLDLSNLEKFIEEYFPHLSIILDHSKDFHVIHYMSYRKLCMDYIREINLPLIQDLPQLKPFSSYLDKYHSWHRVAFNSIVVRRLETDYEGRINSIKKKLNEAQVPYVAVSKNEYAITFRNAVYLIDRLEYCGLLHHLDKYKTTYPEMFNHPATKFILKNCFNDKSY